ncbi:hypothetical protein PG984_000334 [Apiospora sp. TS-2023a]
MTMPNPHNSETVEVYTQKPPAALLRLLSAHLPHSLSLLRRLQFTKFPGGVTEHARILFASDAALLLPHPSLNGIGVATDEHRSFSAAYLDISRGPETQMWMYSTLERCGHNSADRDEKTMEQRQNALGHAVSVLRTIRRLKNEYAAVPSHSSPLGPCVLAGTLSEALRIALQDEAGIASGNVSPYDKWLLDVRNLPPPADEREGRPLLDPWMRWGVVRREDIPLVLIQSDARQHNKESNRIMKEWRTVKLLPSMAITLEDGTPIAWCFLGPDASLSSLHCEEPYRGRGFAKAVAVKLLKERLRDYGGEDSTLCCAEVAQDNPSSQGVCKSLGGKIGWTVSWSTIDLDTVPMK